MPLALCAHLGEELWERLGREPSILDASWPSFDPALCVDDVIEMPVQVNGKVRGKLKIAKDASEQDVTAAALADPNVAKFTDGKAVRKAVYVPGRILNLIVS